MEHLEPARDRARRCSRRRQTSGTTRNGSNSGEFGYKKCFTAFQIGSLLVLLSTAQVSLAQPQPGTIELGSFRFDYAPQGISALANPRDPFGATIMPTGGQGSRGTPETATLDLDLSYRLADQDDWSQLQTRERTWSASPASGQVTYSNVETDDPLQVVESFTTDGVSLDWSIELEAVGDKPIHIGDLAIRIPMVGPRGSDPHQILCNLLTGAAQLRLSHLRRSVGKLTPTKLSPAP